MKNLFEKVDFHINHKLPFVIYSKPNSSITIGLFQDTQDLVTTDFTKAGFLFHSFDGNQKIFYAKEQSTIVIAVNEFEVQNLETHFDSDKESDKTNFEDLVNSAVNIIKEGTCKKIVVSRTESIQKTIKIEKAFKNMLCMYPSAFKYCWYHPQIGLWMGATPEQLLKEKDTIIQTVSLAGTRLKSSNDIWGAKEQEEQKMVTDFIVSHLKLNCDSVVSSNPYTVEAGNIQHIKTDISARMKSNSSLDKIIASLHPTPAVCGLPKEEAKAFILTHESYEREFYAGYLGEINFDFENQTKATDLFVNLRCMQIESDAVKLYIGCGITAESNAEKEYYETVNKSVTMKKII